MKNGIYLLGILALASCATEQQKQTTWDVKVTKQGEKKIWVWKHDGSKQCDSPSQLTPSRAALDLKQAGVMVYQSRTGSDGMMYPSVCGAGTGKTVELEIASADIAKAQQSGFKVKQAQN